MTAFVFARNILTKQSIRPPKIIYTSTSYLSGFTALHGSPRFARDVGFRLCEEHCDEAIQLLWLFKRCLDRRALLAMAVQAMQTTQAIT
jgi:hypothetical protein